MPTYSMVPRPAFSASCSKSESPTHETVQLRQVGTKLDDPAALVVSSGVGPFLDVVTSAAAIADTTRSDRDFIESVSAEESSDAGDDDD
jgi:hypothetical protein